MKKVLILMALLIPPTFAFGLAPISDSRLETTRSDQAGISIVVTNFYILTPKGPLTIQVADGASIVKFKTFDTETVTNTDGMPAHLPFGLIDYRVDLPVGIDTAEITISFPEAVPADAEWYKYDENDGWSVFNNADFSSDRKSVTLTITDGGDGDTDHAKDGVVIDPAGVGFNHDVSTNAESSSDPGGCFIAAASPL